jgi:hypothetical protein
MVFVRALGVCVRVKRSRKEGETTECLAAPIAFRPQGPRLILTSSYGFAVGLLDTFRCLSTNTSPSYGLKFASLQRQTAKETTPPIYAITGSYPHDLPK